MKNIEETIEEIKPIDKLFRITLENISSHIYRGIDFNHIREQCKGAVHFEIKSDVLKEGEPRISIDYKIESVASEFEKFLRRQSLQNKKILLNLGLEYIQRIESKDEGT